MFADGVLRADRGPAWPRWPAAGGALEFAIGTGRVGIPLAARRHSR